jgi:hypothetical protein
VADGKRLAVHGVRQDRLRVKGIGQIDRSRNRARRKRSAQWNTMYFALPDSRRGAAAERAEARPLADRAPPFHAIVPGDLGALRQRRGLRQADRQRLGDQPSTTSRQSAKRSPRARIVRRSGIARAIDAEHRGKIGAGEFRASGLAIVTIRCAVRVAFSPSDSTSRTEGEASAVAARKQQPAPIRRCGARVMPRPPSWLRPLRQAIPAGDHRAQFVDRPGQHHHGQMDRDEQRHPRAQRKWMDRADCRPPSRSSSQGHAAFMVGDMARPVRITVGIRIRITAR